MNTTVLSTIVVIIAFLALGLTVSASPTSSAVTTPTASPHYVYIVDASPSMGRSIPAVAAAVNSTLNAMTAVGTSPQGGHFTLLVVNHEVVASYDVSSWNNLPTEARRHILETLMETTTILGGTSITLGLEQALAIHNDLVRRGLVLDPCTHFFALTDGKDDDLQPASPDFAATLRRRNISLHAIMFGPDAEPSLHDLAAASPGGSVMAAHSASPAMQHVDLAPVAKAIQDTMAATNAWCSCNDSDSDSGMVTKLEVLVHAAVTPAEAAVSIPLVVASYHQIVSVTVASGGQVVLMDPSGLQHSPIAESQGSLEFAIHGPVEGTWLVKVDSGIVRATASWAQHKRGGANISSVQLHTQASSSGARSFDVWDASSQVVVEFFATLDGQRLRLSSNSSATTAVSLWHPDGRVSQWAPRQAVEGMYKVTIGCRDIPTAGPHQVRVSMAVTEGQHRFSRVANAGVVTVRHLAGCAADTGDLTWRRPWWYPSLFEAVVGACGIFLALVGATNLLLWGRHPPVVPRRVVVAKVVAKPETSTRSWRN